MHRWMDGLKCSKNIISTIIKYTKKLPRWAMIISTYFLKYANWDLLLVIGGLFLSGTVLSSQGRGWSNCTDICCITWGSASWSRGRASSVVRRQRRAPHGTRRSFHQGHKTKAVWDLGIARFRGKCLIVLHILTLMTNIKDIKGERLGVRKENKAWITAQTTSALWSPNVP